MVEPFTVPDGFFSKTCCRLSTNESRKKLIESLEICTVGGRRVEMWGGFDQQPTRQNKGVIPFVVLKRSLSLDGSSPLQEMWHSVMEGHWFACTSLSRLLRITVQGKRQYRVGAASSPRGCWRAEGPWLCWRWWMFHSSLGWKTGHNAGCLTPMGNGELNQGLCVQGSVK